MRIAFIGGGGNMATALISGLIKSGISSRNLYAIDINEIALERIKNEFGVRISSSIDESLLDYDVVILAVKPQILKKIAQTISGYLTSQLVISVVAGIPGVDLICWLNGYSRIVRTMPNFPVFICLGITGLVAFDVDVEGRTLASDVFSLVGKTIWFDDESKLNAVTAISGSGPAYVFYFIEALQEAAHQLGLSYEHSRILSTTTFTGAAQLALQSSKPVNILRENITSNGGTTEASIHEFTVHGVKEAIVKGILEANNRANELGHESKISPLLSNRRRS